MSCMISEAIRAGENGLDLYRRHVTMVFFLPTGPSGQGNTPCVIRFY